jgi:ketosteroid isomerase-like protein
MGVTVLAPSTTPTIRKTIIVEQDAFGISTSTGAFALPNIVVLTARNGQIAHLRDYVNVLAAAAARGRDIAVHTD